MSDLFGSEEVFINSIIGEGTRYNGNIELNGLLRIDGDFIGTIKNSGKVLIGKSGRANCSIQASIIVIGGVIKGDVIASEKVIILSSGLVLGNIRSPRLIAEEGVIINGGCFIHENKEKSPKKVSTSGEKLDEFKEKKTVYDPFKAKVGSS